MNDLTSDLVFLFGVFGAGLLSFFAPCILPLIPVYVSYLSGSMVNGTNQQQSDNNSVQLRSTLVLRTFLFVLGLSLVFVLLGFGSGIVGNMISSPVFIAICGAIVVLFGIYQTGLIRLSWLERERKLSSDHARRGGYVGAFLLGLTFSFGWTPCIGSVLAAILGIAAGEGSPLYGGFLMFLYTLGLAIPFLILSIFSEYVMKRIRRLYRYMGVIKITSGCILIVMGLLLMTDRLNSLVTWFQ
ncbi:cytochrome c biogenesis protein CcdA [Paenibacillus sp. PK1-4R]|uniref:cytochrome c biogenesis CcdA family protein n=1 Tax=Paenibacillus sp. PK1-4R TaxID=3049075 RepID=UPI00205D2933|nr:cytochrome c biogenesis protein CcdA [Paenibacillus sp. PK1-4R]UOK65844.1 cytochrome c biogenesis protein CcdA [Paenibacillus sp. OVF10]WJM11325.1 cytochrome c biogenesis protein CcdA [Paenibacillus sp. PK1-4R]